MTQTSLLKQKTTINLAFFDTFSKYLVPQVRTLQFIVTTNFGKWPMSRTLGKQVSAYHFFLNWCAFVGSCIPKLPLWFSIAKSFLLLLHKVQVIKLLVWYLSLTSCYQRTCLCNEKNWKQRWSELVLVQKNEINGKVLRRLDSSNKLLSDAKSDLLVWPTYRITNWKLNNICVHVALKCVSDPIRQTKDSRLDFMSFASYSNADTPHLPFN